MSINPLHNISSNTLEGVRSKIQIQIQYVLFIKLQTGLCHQRPREDIHKLMYHPKEYLKSIGICVSFPVFHGVKIRGEVWPSI